MSESGQTLRPEYFDALYTADPDPWKFAASRYERDKYALTLDAMPKLRYRSALEVGCSIGVLTRSLAPRCDVLVAIDAAQTPLVEARRRCADLPGVGCGETTMRVQRPMPNAPHPWLSRPSRCREPTDPLHRPSERSPTGSL
jgi:Nodulation protein S (NodS)